MKKRALCLLLLFAMLLTGIPFVASAEEVTPEETEAVEPEIRSEYHDLYIDDGLVGLFTAFAGDTSVSLTDGKGTWYNRIEGGSSAAFAGSKGWNFGANGGVGYELIYGQIAEDGTFMTTYDGNTYDNVNKLVFDLALLPKDDFTLEYVAHYTPHYCYDVTKGELVVAAETGNTNATTPNNIKSEPVDVVGFMVSYSAHPGNIFEGAIKLRWRVVDKAGYKTWEDTNYGMGGWDFANRMNGKIGTYAITRDETVTGADDTLVTKAQYIHYLDFATQATINVTSKTALGRGRYYHQDDDTEFYLSYRNGTTFYALRVYDRVLTDAEMKHNRGVDALNYYAVEMPEERVSDNAYMNRLLSAMAELPLEDEASAYAATRAEAQALADNLYPEFDDLHELYVKDELSLLFTTFDDYASTVNLTAGTWTDIVSGKTATFDVKSRWSKNANGAVGFNTFYGTLDASGNYTATSSGNNQEANAKLNFGIALLPTEDFTVEYMAMYKPLYLYDATQADGIMRDVDGNKLETFDFDQNTTGIFVQKLAVDNLGWFQGLTSQLDGVIFKDWRITSTGSALTAEQLTATRGIIHWTFAMHNGDAGGWFLDGSGRQSWWLGNGKAMKHDGGLNIPGDVFQQNDVIRSYAISVDETVTEAGDTEAVFSLYRDATFYNSNEAQGEVNTSAKGMADGGYIATEFDSKCRFWLSANRPTDFYAVRVYEKELTEAERRQNRAVDVMLYYGIEVHKSLFDNEAVMNRIYIQLSDEVFYQDAVEIAANRARLQAIVSAEASRTSLVDRYAATEHLTALFTTFYPDTVDLAAGTWTDLVLGKTATLATQGKSTWHTTVHGAIGFNNFYGSYEDSDGDGAKEVVDEDTQQKYLLNSATVGVGSRLEFGISMLPTSDFSVEYMAMYRPLYVYDATASDYIARDEDGNKLEAALEGLTTPLHVQYPIDQLGWFTSLATRLDSTSHYWDGADSVGRGTVQWQFDNPRWYYGHNSWYVGGGKHVADSGLNKPKDPYQTNDAVRVYGIYLDETLTVAKDGTRTTTALFETYRDSVLYGSNASAISTTANASGGKAYYDIDTPFVSGQHKFWLSSTRPTEFFTVRIYDVALTDAQKKQNYAIDMMLYYGVVVPDALWENEAFFAQIIDMFADVTALTDATARTAGAQSLQEKIDALLEDYALIEEMKARYAQPEKLTALYTVYADMSLNVDDGVWLDYVGAQKATLGNKQYWHVNADGSFGYNIFYGTLDENGAYTATSSYNNYSTTGTRLEFGIAALPKNDFTVEYVANYHPVYLANAEGGIYTDQEGNKLETMSYADNTPGSQQYGANNVAPIDQLGFLHSWTTSRDGKFSGSGIRGGLYFCYGDMTISSDAWSAYYWSQTFFKTNEIFYQRDSIHSYAITRAKTTADGLVTATYTLLRDATTYASGTMDKTKFEGYADNKNGYTLDFAQDDRGYFYLAERLPVDFYSVRIYSVKLTDAERAHNHFVDLAYYYEIEIPALIQNNAELFAEVATALADVTMATDAVTYASEKARITDALEEIVQRSSASTLYVQNGLTALYTAFAGQDDYVGALENDLVWYNRVLGNPSATFEKRGWTFGTTRGGVGYDLIYGTVNTEAGTFSTSGAQNNYARGNRLNVGLAQLPNADFTLEYVAYYSPVLSYDTATEKLVDTYETGISAAVTPTEGAYEPVDTVGFLSSYTTQHGGYFYVTSGVNVLGLLRWRSMDKAGYKTWKDNGYGWGGKLVTENRASRTIETYAITRDEETSGDVVTAVYTHRLNGAFVDDNDFSSANTTGEHRYYSFEDDTEFYLSYKLGTTFYALRIYNRVLSEEEQAQNRMADMLGFYGITLPEDFLTNTERYEYVKSLCAEMTFERDAVAYNASKGLLQTEAAGSGNAVTLIVDGEETLEIVYEDAYLLPSAVEGKEIFAWMLLHEDGSYTSYAPGGVLPLSGSATVKALLFTAPVTQYGVSIRPMEENGFGMRFTATVDKAEYLALRKEYGAEYIRMSILITPKAYVTRAGNFTRDALRKYVTQHGVNASRAYIEIPSDGFYAVDQDVCTLAGTIYNFSSVTKEKNPEFAAIACVDVDTDKDGIFERSVYGEYRAATCRSPKKAIESVAYTGAQLTDSQQAWMDNFLSYYTNRTYGGEGDKTVGEQRAEIQAAFTSAMNTTVKYTVHEFAEDEVDEKYRHIQAISFDGLKSNGKKTRIFAYIGLPEGASAENPVPAMVLVHGGGGHAYMEWVRLWNERGYAAIAMENTGYFPVTPGACPTDSNANAERAFPDYIRDVIDESEYVIAPIGKNRFTTTYAEVDEQWQYHGLSSVILSHNVLRQLEEVDSNLIGTIGVSWGGTMVSQVIGYDTRFAFAIPSYGSAYLGEPERSFGSYNDPYVDDLWAAERNLDNFKNPILWFDWADDNNFVVNAYSKSYLHSLKNNPKNTFVLLKDWGHSHHHVWNMEHGYAFADSICFPETSAPYANFVSQPNGQNAASTVNLPQGATNVKVRFHYLEEPMVYKEFNKFGSLNSNWLVEYWKTDNTTLSIDAATGAITGTIPENVRAYYISVTYTIDGVALETSSSFIMIR